MKIFIDKEMFFVKIYATGNTSFSFPLVSAAQKKAAAVLPALQQKASSKADRFEWSGSLPSTPAESVTASSGSDTLTAEKTGQGYKIHFEDAAQISRTVERGTLTVDGVEVPLDDAAKAKLSAIGEQLTAQQEAATQQSNMQHDLAVAQQQSEAVNSAMKKLSELLKIFTLFSSGKRVSPVDVQRLMQEEPDLYKVASSMRTLALEKNRDKGDGKQISTEDEPASDNTNLADMDAPSLEVQMSVSMSSGTPTVGSLSVRTVEA